MPTQSDSARVSCFSVPLHFQCASCSQFDSLPLTYSVPFRVTFVLSVAATKIPMKLFMSFALACVPWLKVRALVCVASSTAVCRPISQLLVHTGATRTRARPRYPEDFLKLLCAPVYSVYLDHSRSRHRPHLAVASARLLFPTHRIASYLPPLHLRIPADVNNSTMCIAHMHVPTAGELERGED